MDVALFAFAFISTFVYKYNMHVAWANTNILSWNWTMVVENYSNFIWNANQHWNTNQHHSLWSLETLSQNIGMNGTLCENQFYSRKQYINIITGSIIVTGYRFRKNGPHKRSAGKKMNCCLNSTFCSSSILITWWK